MAITGYHNHCFLLFEYCTTFFNQKVALLSNMSFQRAVLYWLKKGATKNDLKEGYSHSLHWSMAGE